MSETLLRIYICYFLNMYNKKSSVVLKISCLLQKKTGVGKKTVHIFIIHRSYYFNFLIFYLYQQNSTYNPKNYRWRQRILLFIFYFKLVTHVTAKFEKHPPMRSVENSCGVVATTQGSCSPSRVGCGHMLVRCIRTLKFRLAHTR